MKKIKIYVVGGTTHYANWMNGDIVYDLEEADLVVFTGGEDVDPSLYKEPKNPRTFSNLARDQREILMYNKCLELKKKMIGICRGSQFLCVMAGGRLVQHQHNPHYIHDIITIDRKVIPITSTHHQAQYPQMMKPNDWKMIAWTKGISKTHENGNSSQMIVDREAEIVYYPKIRALGIQGHPENLYGEEEYSETMKYLDELLNKFLKDKL